MTLADKCTVYQPPSFKLEVFKFSWLSYKLFCVCVHTCIIRPEHFRWCSSGAATRLFLDRISSLASEPQGFSHVCPQHRYHKHILLSFITWALGTELRSSQILLMATSLLASF